MDAAAGPAEYWRELGAEAADIARKAGISEVTLEITPVWGGKNHVRATSGGFFGAFVSRDECAA